MRRLLECFGESRRRVLHCNELDSVAVGAINISKRGVADANSLLQHGGKHRLEVAGGATDDLKNLRRGRLLL